MRGRKRTRPRGPHTWNRELWEKIDSLSGEEFASERQKKVIQEMLVSNGRYSVQFAKIQEYYLETHPLRLLIRIWLEVTDPNSYTYEAVEKVAKAYLSGALEGE